MLQRQSYKLGAQWLGDGRVHFLVWSPTSASIDVHVLRDDRIVALQKNERGYFAGILDDLQVGDRYFYRIDGERERPDPASRHQPDGVHGASQIVDPSFVWTDQGFSPPNLRNSIFYELHIGTITDAGTFRALMDHLPYLRDLGITTLQIMPVAQFPGTRNWGYDGVQLYAPQNSYGSPQDFKALVNAAHNHGLAVFLDVVYNHLGPEGNYLWDYGPYFTDRYQGVWGDSLNFDGRGSDEVRRYFIENAIYWLEEFHIDGLRLDATHALKDFRAIPVLEDLAAQVHEWADENNRRVHLIAENDQSNRRLVQPRAAGGVGLDGQWLDDFHHSVHVALTGETKGYFVDYEEFRMMIKVLRDRFALSGQYSKNHGRRHGTYAGDIPADRYIVATQTHDQVGNRRMGDRLYHRSGLAGAKLAAGYLLTSPYTPMLFMGQEYGEEAPFQFFTSFGDAHLIEAVREGRKAEFAYFADQGEPPDPHDEATFTRSKLQYALRHEGEHAILFALYQRLLRLRREQPALTNPQPIHTAIYADFAKRVFCMERRHPSGTLRMVFNWDLQQAHAFAMPASEATWEKLLDSNAPEWQPDSSDTRSTPQTLHATQAIIEIPSTSFVIYRET